MKNSKNLIIIGSGLLFGSIILIWLFFLNHVSVNEIGIAYNSRNGNLTIQTQPGWYYTSPLTRVINLPTLPIIVHLPTFAKIINTRIIRLKPEGIPELIKLQGFNIGLSSQFENIMMGYAFSGQSFSFLEILQQGSKEETK